MDAKSSLSFYSAIWSLSVFSGLDHVVSLFRAILLATSVAWTSASWRRALYLFVSCRASSNGAPVTVARSGSATCVPKIRFMLSRSRSIYNLVAPYCIAALASGLPTPGPSILYFLHSFASLVATSSCFVPVLTIPSTPLVTSRWKCLPALVDEYKT
jgi:hypothetical protein